MARIQIDDIRKELEKDGWKLISTEYHNLDENLEFLCDENHHVFAPWKKVRVRRECPVCKANPYKEMKIDCIPKKKGTFRVLALDQATKISGFSLLDNKKLVKYGIYTVPEINDEIERDHQIKQWLISMINNWEVDYVALEGIQYQERFGVTTFETLARLQGILMETLFTLDIPYMVCPTNTWRHHCGVKGRTRSDRKQSMKNLVKEWFDISVTDDCADAIGIGKYASETATPNIETFNWE